MEFLKLSSDFWFWEYFLFFVIVIFRIICLTYMAWCRDLFDTIEKQKA